MGESREKGDYFKDRIFYIRGGATRRIMGILLYRFKNSVSLGMGLTFNVNSLVVLILNLIIVFLRGDRL